jgi:hypothetical protein
MQDFWQSSGFNTLKPNDQGWLVPTDAYLRLFISRPELALVPESGAAEHALHETLSSCPSRVVGAEEIEAIDDADVRENYTHFLDFRDALLAAGTLEAYYIHLFQHGPIDIPPLFIDLMTQAMVRNILDGCEDSYQVRAGEMLFRRQRVSTENGQILCADANAIEMFAEDGGFGSVGRLFAQSNTPVRAVNMDVLSHETAPLYWLKDEHFAYVLDLTHGRPGLDALARVLEKWVTHFLRVSVNVAPVQRIEDDVWRWHIGLDAQASTLLNDLYAGKEVDEARARRLISLFRLDFTNSGEMRSDVAGRPIYLGLAFDDQKVLKLKPQNLLINLPIANSM